MFNLELAWNRPNKNISDVTDHVLRVSLIPQGSAGGDHGLPLHVAIALDTSNSMTQDHKLQHAKEACRKVVEQLRHIDRLSIAGFSQKVTPIIQSVKGGNAALAQATTAINGLTVGGNTRTDLALNWFQEALPRQEGVIRVGVLITDGNPTNGMGRTFQDNTFMLNQAVSLRNSGVLLYTVGLGNAANFNTQFLVNLSDRGRGQFMYASTPSELEPQLTNMLARCQAIATEDAKLTFNLSHGVNIKTYCYIRPEYLPPDSENEIANNELAIPGIRMDTRTDLLFELEIPGDLNFEPQRGNREVVSVQLTALVLTDTISAKAEINYTEKLIEAQKINKDVEQDAQRWDMNVHQDVLLSINNDDPNKTGELLLLIENEATQLGEEKIAKQAQEQKEYLKKTGELNPDLSAKMLAESRGGFGAAPPKARLTPDNAHLLVLNGPKQGQSLPLSKTEIKLGRTVADGMMVDIDLTEYEIDSTKSVVGRYHAQLRWVEGVLQINDNNSRNGTFIDGNRLDPSRDGSVNLHEGSKVKLGNLEFEVIAR